MINRDQGRIQGGGGGVPRHPPPPGGGGGVPRGGGGRQGEVMILTKMTLENISDVPQICSGTLRIAPRALRGALVVSPFTNCVANIVDSL